MLDLGCGPGKLTYPLAAIAARVDAVDISAAMIEAAKVDARPDDNIRWICGDIHEVALGNHYDLIVAGASIHWMGLDRLFPTLKSKQDENGVIAFVEGDGAFNHPWERAELDVMIDHQLRMNEERPAWVDSVRCPAQPKQVLVEHENFERTGSRVIGPHRVTKSVDDYINIFFSRASFDDGMYAGRTTRRIFSRHDESVSTVSV